jgi:hypothetical protein
MDSASANIRFGLALVAGAQGRTAEALEHLEAAIERGFTNYIWIKIHPDLESLYQEPGFHTLLARHLKARGA